MSRFLVLRETYSEFDCISILELDLLPTTSDGRVDLTGSDYRKRPLHVINLVRLTHLLRRAASGTLHYMKDLPYSSPRGLCKTQVRRVL
jgi:hypothetical protein